LALPYDERINEKMGGDFKTWNISRGQKARGLAELEALGLISLDRRQQTKWQATLIY
jgi:hypothetical protein